MSSGTSYHFDTFSIDPVVRRMTRAGEEVRLMQNRSSASGAFAHTGSDRRGACPTEFGVGPNLTPAGLALAMAAGVTFRTGLMNVPSNLAVVPSKAGMRVSVLTGFTMRRR